MDKMFVRNFIVFVFILLACVAALTYRLVSGEETLVKKDNLVEHTYQVISESERLSFSIERMISSQRGYLLTSKSTFLDQYSKKKTEAREHIGRISSLTTENLSQQRRIDAILDYYNKLALELENRVKAVQLDGYTEVIEDVTSINQLRNDIITLNDDVLSEEYELLEERINNIEEKKSQYFSSLLVGITVGTLLLLLLNAFLLRAQKKRSVAEASLSDSQQRFMLAVEGTQEGIFDWDLKTGAIFYSRRFFSMLGYEEKSSHTGTKDDFIKLLYPDDVKKVWDYVEDYIHGRIDEYVQEFRMKHKNDEYVWIQARAKALFDDNGKAFRMVGTHTDITPMMKAQEKLEYEKTQAEQANELKSEFLAHMSHEIRTPLTTISGIAEILNKQMQKFDDKQKQLIITLSTSSQALKDLINDILDFSKIESGEIDLESTSFSLNKLFAEIVSIMSVRAGDKNIEFDVLIDDVSEYDFYGDRGRIRQILINLVGNAMKFIDKGHVTLTSNFVTFKEQDYLNIIVTDTGIGIEKGKLDVVFERFKQADSSVSRKYGGTGLGLPISKNLAQIMGGDLTLESVFGEGSIFTLTLPVTQKVNKSLDDSAIRKAAKPNKSKKNAKLQQSKKVLLVEDYEGNIVVIGYILDDLNLSYDVAKNGQEAIKLYEANDYGVILMDVQMPIIDGFVATRTIRNAETIAGGGKYTPIIGMTAHALVGDKDKCIESGMDAYLPKPIVEDDLKHEITKYLTMKNPEE